MRGLAPSFFSTSIQFYPDGFFSVGEVFPPLSTTTLFHRQTEVSTLLCVRNSSVFQTWTTETPSAVSKENRVHGHSSILYIPSQPKHDPFILPNSNHLPTQPFNRIHVTYLFIFFLSLYLMGKDARFFPCHNTGPILTFFQLS